MIFTWVGHDDRAENVRINHRKRPLFVMQRLGLEAQNPEAVLLSEDLEVGPFEVEERSLEFDGLGVEKF